MKAILILVILLSAVAVNAQADGRELGVQLYRDGKYAAAASQLESVTTTDAKDRQGWLYLGATYAHLGRTDDAKKAFRASRMRQTANLPKFDKALKVISKPQPAFRRGVDEPSPIVVTVAVEFMADGTIGVVVPFQDKTSAHEDAAIEAARNIKFEPAEMGGKPVTTVMVLEYKFSRY